MNGTIQQDDLTMYVVLTSLRVIQTSIEVDSRTLFTTVADG